MPISPCIQPISSQQTQVHLPYEHVFEFLRAELLKSEIMNAYLNQKLTCILAYEHVFLLMNMYSLRAEFLKSEINMYSCLCMLEIRIMKDV